MHHLLVYLKVSVLTQYYQVVSCSVKTILLHANCVKEVFQVATRAIPQTSSFLCVARGFSNMSSIPAAGYINWSRSLLPVLASEGCYRCGGTCLVKCTCITDQEIMTSAFLMYDGHVIGRDNNDTVNQTCDQLRKRVKHLWWIPLRDNICDIHLFLKDHSDPSIYQR